MYLFQLLSCSDRQYLSTFLIYEKTLFITNIYMPDLLIWRLRPPFLCIYNLLLCFVIRLASIGDLTTLHNIFS